MTRSVLTAFAIGASALTASVAAPCAYAQRGSSSPSSPSAPGWVGISLIQHGTGSDAYGMSLEYPVVASVEPGSPAQVAGLAAGDTILAYNDVDAHEEPLGFEHFLKPGTRILFKVRHNGAHEYPLTVARRPARDRMSVAVRVDASESPASGVPPMIRVGVPVMAPVALQREAPLFGAQLARLNAGLASALNVRNAGVLVVDIAPGSPAMSSGLQSGDIIVQADSITVQSPLEIVRATRAASSRTVTLGILRRGKEQKIALHW